MRKFKKSLEKLINNKTFHIILTIAMIIAIIIIALIIMLRYSIKGEDQIPFDISKIEVISSAGGENIEDEQNTDRWNINVSQNNDFYIYLEKNKDFKERKQEVISSVLIENIQIEKVSENGENKIYKPDAESPKELFKNTEVNEVDKIEYIGAPESNIKKLQMSNQGDLIYFRFTNKDIKQYTSNDEELNYNELLKKAGVKEEDLKATIKFDIIINLISKKSFRTNVTAELPIEGVVEKGTATKQIIDKDKLIFKRD